jgi:hypothetical protein
MVHGIKITVKNITGFYLYNKTNQMHQFHKFIPAWNCTFFGQLLCPSSGVYSLYTQQWYMWYRFVDTAFNQDLLESCVYKPVWHIPLLSVQWINSWWWTDELSETCRISRQNKFVKLVHLDGFIIKKSVTMQRGHMNVKFIMAIRTYIRSVIFCAVWYKFCRHVKHQAYFRYNESSSVTSHKYFTDLLSISEY